MEVILKTNVPSLGRPGDIVKVADGYARNYLLPKGFAAESTTRNLKMWENEKKGSEKKMLKLKEDAQRLCMELEAVTCTFSRKAGEDDKLFGSVTSMDIEDYLKGKGFTVDRKKIILPEPIRIIGEYTVSVKLHQEVTANIKVVVVKE